MRLTKSELKKVEELLKWVPGAFMYGTTCVGDIHDEAIEIVKSMVRNCEIDTTSSDTEQEAAIRQHLIRLEGD